MASKIYTRANNAEVVPGIYRSWCLTHDDREGRVVCIEPKAEGSKNLFVRVVGDKGNNLNHISAWLEVNVLSKITEDDFVSVVEDDDLIAAYRNGKVVRLNNAPESTYYVKSHHMVITEDRVLAAPTITCCLTPDLSGIDGYMDKDTPTIPGCGYRIEHKERPHA